MPVSAETLRLLMDAGIEGDDLLRIVESIDKQEAPERSSGAIRQARYRANKKAQTVTSDVTRDVTASVTPRAHVEDISSNQEISGKSNKKSARDHLADFKNALLPDLGEERLEAFVLHRKTKRGALTGYGAKLFRQDCAECGLSLAEGADMAMSRGWITVKAEYLKRTTGPPGKRSYADVAIDKFSGQANGSESVFGSHGNAQRIPPRLIESRPDDADIRGGIGRRFQPSDH